LDLILTRYEQISEQLVSKVAVQSVCFSDHHLLTCRLAVPLPQPVTTTYTYWSLRKIDRAALSVDILQSRLYGELELDADSYADLFDAEVKRVLDIHAPARQPTPIGRGVLNVGTVEPAYSQTARESILKSRAVIVKSELDEAAGDVRATWRTAQRLLHSRHKGCV